METSDFAQKLLHDLRLRKERMANCQNSDMYQYHYSRQNFKGSRETRIFEVNHKTGSRYKSPRNNQKAPTHPQSANQIVPYGGHNSGQVNDLSLALAYAFDNRGKLKRFDITSNGPMMKMLQQVRTSTQQRLDIQWQSTNQFPNLTNLHINEISKGAQKLNQLLRACSSGFNVNRDSIEMGKELWREAMELEQSLRMLESLQEVSSNNPVNPQRKRLRLLDEDGDSEDDSTGNSKQKQVEHPVFSFDRKPSKNTKVNVQKLTVQPQLEDPSPKAERKLSITTINNHRHFASCESEQYTAQFNNCSTSNQNAARLPNVIAKLMGLEELPQNSNQKVGADSASQQRSRDSVTSQTSQKSSKKADLRIEHTRPPKNPLNEIRVQSNKITILTSRKKELQADTYRSPKNHDNKSDRDNPNKRMEERHAIKNYVQESKAAISKINKLQTKSMNLNEDSKTQNDVRKEANVKSMKQKQEAATNVSQGTTPPGNRSLNKAEKAHADNTLGNSDNQETQKLKTSNLQHTRKKQDRDMELQKVNMSYQPHVDSLTKKNRSQPDTNHRTEVRRREKNAEILHSSRVIARDVKENPNFAVSKALSSNEQNEDPTDKVSKNSNVAKNNSISLKLEPEKMVVRRTSHMKARSEKREFNDRPTVKTYKEIIVPRTTSRTLKHHKSTSEKQKQHQSDNISVSREATKANVDIPESTESTPRKDEPRNPSLDCEKSKQNEDDNQMDSKNQTIKGELLRQKEATKITLGDKDKENLSSIYDDHQEVATDEVRVKSQVTPTDDRESCLVNRYQQQNPSKVEKQEPLTEDEMFMKQKLILSHLFLNTAEALFKLNIPISILNYASDQISEESDKKFIIDCAYELLKRKGRRKETSIYPIINISMTYARIKSFDDLVRQLSKDFEALRSYGRNEKDVDDYANCILKMLESDIYNRCPDLNSMWDHGWNKEMFPCDNIDEVICNIEQIMIDELMNEFINEFL